MATLGIELQDGFEGDEVVCTVDGREVLRRSAVRTDLRISRADSVEVQVPDDPSTVQVQVPNRSLAAEARLVPREERYLLVRIVEGRLQATPAADMPFYL